MTPANPNEEQAKKLDQFSAAVSKALQDAFGKEAVGCVVHLYVHSSEPGRITGGTTMILVDQPSIEQAADAAITIVRSTPEMSKAWAERVQQEWEESLPKAPTKAEKSRIIIP